ncbi:MAG: response regulator transcription factor [Bacteroidales bacterium]|nr:response regulator transcription factor [Bacteroidales bacterium]
MRCIAIDDEPLALEIIRDFCSKVGFLELKATYTNPLEAFEMIHMHAVDLVFIDIQMPNITGLEFMKTLSDPPLIIFTTAFSEHALEGFELSAVDYLIKPIPFERFMKAVNKAYELHTLRKGKTTELAPEPEKPVAASDYLLVKSEYSTLKINLSDIQFIEGLKDYIRIHMPGKTVMTKNTMKNIESRLPEDQFIRIHKSFIVALAKIEKIENNRIIFGNKYIPIGNHFKDDFYQQLGKYSL